MPENAKCENCGCTEFIKEKEEQGNSQFDALKDLEFDD